LLLVLDGVLAARRPLGGASTPSRNICSGPAKPPTPPPKD